MAQSLAQGDFVEVAFQTQAGPVHGMAEVLTPMRKLNNGVLQPFRFVALEDEDHRRLRTSLDHVVDRNCWDEVERFRRTERSGGDSRPLIRSERLAVRQRSEPRASPDMKLVPLTRR